MIKIKRTVYPDCKVVDHQPKNVPIGHMIEFWSYNGSFNLDLYKVIALYKTGRNE